LKQQKYTYPYAVHLYFGLSWRLRWYRIHMPCRTPRFDTWVGKIPWSRAWQPTPVLVPVESPWTGESGGLRSMGS